MLNPSRPSLLDQVKLTDGRLAWPVARDRGMSEAAFRLRLKRLSPDDAALGAFEKRAPSDVKARAQRVAAFAAARADDRAAAHWPPAIDFLHDDYSGVIWSDADLRLCVTPRGASYFLQSKRSGSWVTFHNFEAASALRSFVNVVLHDPSDGLLEAVAGLPNDPRDCAAVSLPCPPDRGNSALHVLE